MLSCFDNNKVFTLVPKSGPERFEGHYLRKIFIGFMRMGSLRRTNLFDPQNVFRDLKNAILKNKANALIYDHLTNQL